MKPSCAESDYLKQDLEHKELIKIQTGEGSLFIGAERKEDK